MPQFISQALRLRTSHVILGQFSSVTTRLLIVSPLHSCLPHQKIGPGFHCMTGRQKVEDSCNPDSLTLTSSVTCVFTQFTKPSSLTFTNSFVHYGPIYTNCLLWGRQAITRIVFITAAFTSQSVNRNQNSDPNTGKIILIDLWPVPSDRSAVFRSEGFFAQRTFSLPSIAQLWHSLDIQSLQRSNLPNGSEY